MKIDYIPEPTIILLGCQPWPPRSSSGVCPVCGEHITRHGTYCAWSDEMDRDAEAKLRSVRLGIEHKDQARITRQKTQSHLSRKKVVLSESERRRIWNGYKGSILSELGPQFLTNRAKEGRDFLKRIHQEPRWDAELKFR